MIGIDKDYLKELRMSVCYKGNPIKKVGNAISEVAGGLTGGLIGKDPNREAKREARRQEQATKKRIEQEQQARENEKAFTDEVEKDKQALDDAVGTRQAKPEVDVSVDFSKAVKGKKDDEDKLKKSLKKAFRG